MTYFIMEPTHTPDYESPTYLQVPDALVKETREYIEAYAFHEIAAVVTDFVEKPDVIPLRRFLEEDLGRALR